MASGLKAYSTVRSDEVKARMERLAQLALERIAMYGMRAAQKNIPVDTGYARGHISYRVSRGDAQFGVIYPFRNLEGEIATYPAMMEVGITRHYVYTTARDGSIRWGIVKWLERHGFRVWKSISGRGVRRRPKNPTASLLAIRRIPVWGYRVAWMTKAKEETEAAVPDILRTLEGML